ncbi:MAG: prepilin-type N-terminal cleavage/methylation domain-containing protein [Terrimicrobiaceae bacterium]|nr:prepilin-type N-terminal cleavage/methylation domain-containing protein [Terrimicrobiaceae bacterium]
MKTRGYTLVEVMIAGTLLLIGIGAAALLANTLLRQQFFATETTRALNMQEQAVRLFQLGMDATEIAAVLPAKVVATDPPGEGEIHLQFATSAQTITGVGSVEIGTCRIVYSSGDDPDGDSLYRTNEVTVVRPSTRR